MNRKMLASAMTVGVLSAPVAIAVADENDTTRSNEARATAHQYRMLVKQRVEAERAAKRAEARERKAERKAKAKKRAKKRAKLAKKRAAAQRQTAAAPSAGNSQPQQSTAGGGGTATPGHLQAIAACESGGDPSAVGGGGAYRGKYQFDRQTWASVGGSGDPAAAPEAEQDKRAAMLYSRAGASPWPVCGR